MRPQVGREHSVVDSDLGRDDPRMGRKARAGPAGRVARKAKVRRARGPMARRNARRLKDDAREMKSKEMDRPDAHGSAARRDSVAAREIAQLMKSFTACSNILTATTTAS